jgi:hypothetical protein
MKRFTLTALVALFAAAAPVVHLAAQPFDSAAQSLAQGSESAAPAATVKALFDQLKLTSIAAKDPEEPGRYVAALYIADSQLLVISAPFAVPAALDKFIADGNYMDAYQSLQAVVSHKGHFFVVDMLNDGLKRVNAPDQPFDSTTTDGGATIQFDGKWNEQKLTEADYNAQFAKDDARYARLLKVLATELRKKTTIE